MEPQEKIDNLDNIVTNPVIHPLFEQDGMIIGANATRDEFEVEAEYMPIRFFYRC